jgi:hypothetical protein
LRTFAPPPALFFAARADDGEPDRLLRPRFAADRFAAPRPDPDVRLPALFVDRFPAADALFATASPPENLN